MGQLSQYGPRTVQSRRSALSSTNRPLRVPTRSTLFALGSPPSRRSSFIRPDPRGELIAAFLAARRGLRVERCAARLVRLGEPAQERVQGGAFPVVERREEVVLDLPREAAQALDRLPAFRRHLHPA